jgi:transcription antitermination factor NusG
MTQARDLFEQDNRFFYACAAKSKAEYEVREDLEEVGAWAWVATEVREQRFKGCSEPKISERPLWPGYIFTYLDPYLFFRSRNINNLHATKLQLCPEEARGLLTIIDRVEANKAKALRQIAAGTAPIVDYQQGETLELLDGAFRDRLAAFREIIQRNGQYRLSIHVEGMALPIEVAPQDVRKVG